MCGFNGDGAYLGLSAHARLSLIPTFRPVTAFHLGSCSSLLAHMVSLALLTFLEVLSPGSFLHHPILTGASWGILEFLLPSPVLVLC